MNLQLSPIAVSNCREFRRQIVVDGLKIVIEPDETGKSPLLKALRAASFMRHATRNQLVESSVPHCEAVASPAG